RHLSERPWLPTRGPRPPGSDQTSRSGSRGFCRRGPLRRFNRRRLRFEFEAEVNGWRRVCQGAHRDIVGAGARELGDPVERDTPREFDFGAAAYTPYGSTNVVDRQVVEQNDVRARGDRLIDLFQALSLDLD